MSVFWLHCPFPRIQTPCHSRNSWHYLAPVSACEHICQNSTSCCPISAYNKHRSFLNTGVFSDVFLAVSLRLKNLAHRRPTGKILYTPSGRRPYKEVVALGQKALLSWAKRFYFPTMYLQVGAVWQWVIRHSVCSQGVRVALHSPLVYQWVPRKTPSRDGKPDPASWFREPCCWVPVSRPQGTMDD